MVYTKKVEIQINSADIAKDISGNVADYIDQALRDYLEDRGYPEGTIDDIMEDYNFWSSVIRDLIPYLTA